MSQRLQRSWEIYQAGQQEPPAPEKPVKNGLFGRKHEDKPTPTVPEPEASPIVYAPQPVAPAPKPEPEPVEQRRFEVETPPAPMVIQATVAEPAKTTSQLKRKPKLKKRYLVGAGLVSFAVLAFGGFWFVSHTSKQPAVATVLAARTVREIAGITTDEEPVILNVVDKSKVQQQFLSKAENGDQVMLYYQAQKAVLYRPSSQEVISVGSFTPPPPKVFIRDGSASGSGRLKEVETLLKVRTDIELTSRDRASNDPQETVVVNLSNRYPTQAEELAKTLGTRVVGLPLDESRPEADIMIIIADK